MQIYEELSLDQKIWAKRGALSFLILINLVIASLFLSYMADFWTSAKALRGPKLQVSFSGEGKISAKPDVVKFTATVLSDGKTISEVQGDNTKRFNDVISFLKANGFADKDMKTVGYNVFPQYSYPRPCTVFPCLEDEKPKIVGYQISNTMEITVRDVAKTGDILSGVIDAGANEVSGLQFTIDRPNELKAQARKQAIDDVKAKAGRLAKDLGKKLGRITAFSESGYVPPPVYFKAESAMGGGLAPVPAPDIQTGENEITANVNITYELR
ncbi:MAG: SIMPL domain-containing protein [bacterium]|nr:SIMPL domain-containing protein [bacterium]